MQSALREGRIILHNFARGGEFVGLAVQRDSRVAIDVDVLEQSEVVTCGIYGGWLEELTAFPGGQPLGIHAPTMVMTGS
jgi:hypothetical protein